MDEFDQVPECRVAIGALELIKVLRSFRQRGVAGAKNVNGSPDHLG